MKRRTVLKGIGIGLGTLLLQACVPALPKFRFSENTLEDVLRADIPLRADALQGDVQFHPAHPSWGFVQGFNDSNFVVPFHIGQQAVELFILDNSGLAYPKGYQYGPWKNKDKIDTDDAGNDFRFASWDPLSYNLIVSLEAGGTPMLMVVQPAEDITTQTGGPLFEEVFPISILPTYAMSQEGRLYVQQAEEVTLVDFQKGYRDKPRTEGKIAARYASGHPSFNALKGKLSPRADFAAADRRVYKIGGTPDTITVEESYKIEGNAVGWTTHNGEAVLVQKTATDQYLLWTPDHEVPVERKEKGMQVVIPSDKKGLFLQQGNLFMEIDLHTGKTKTVADLREIVLQTYFYPTVGVHYESGRVVAIDPGNGGLYVFNLRK